MANNIDPTSMLMGWLVGRAVAAQRGKGEVVPDVPVVPDEPNVEITDTYIKWNGNTAGLETAPFACAVVNGTPVLLNYVKVSDAVPSTNLSVYTSHVYADNDGTYTEDLTLDGLSTILDDSCIVINAWYAVICFVDSYELNGTVITKGVWFLAEDGLYNTELYFNPIAYLYNGVVLPDINEVWTDKEKYPYAYISGIVDGMAVLSLSNNQAKVVTEQDTKIIEIPAPHTASLYYLDAGDESWTVLAEDDTSDTESNVIAGTEGELKLIWANVDVLDTDNSTYLAASDPIPVYE